jgi:chaperonin cofactor prefoldin
LTAVGVVAPSVLAKGNIGPKVSSKNAYRVCLTENDELDTKKSDLQKRIHAHTKALKEHQDEMAAHVATQNAVDLENHVAVDAFNTKIDTLNNQVKVLNEQAEIYQKERENLNAEVAAWNKRCASMVVTLKDHDAVQKERQKQGEK